MKKLIALGLLALGLTACNLFPSIEGDGIIQTEKRALPVFDEIELPISAELRVRQGTFEDITIEAESNILDILESRVNNGVLRFTLGGKWIRNHAPIRIWVTTPNINRLSVSGSGKIISDNTIVGKKLELFLSGSGLVDIATDLDNDLFANLSGSGNIYVEGDADFADYELSGSGRVQGFDLRTNDTEASISGSGRCETTCSRQLDANISGSGEVYYRGKPRISKRITGSGRVVDAN